MRLKALINLDTNKVILDYLLWLEEDPEANWTTPTVQQFIDHFEPDIIFGSEGDALDELDIIECSDGEIQGYQIL
jgi:hypothetical protein